jgi:MYXO-CTERM domain-containing protein
VAFVATLAVLALLAGRSLLGAGRLAGGALLPAPDAATDLIGRYAATWQPVGVGGTTGAPPALGLLGLLGLPLSNSASAVVSWLLLAAVPLAGGTAWVAARRLVRATWIRVLVSTTWALVPVVTGAVAGGRLGTVVLTVLLPLVARSVLVTLGRPGAPGPMRPAWTAGLLLAVCCAFTPVVWFAAAVLGAAAAGLVRGWATRVAAVVLTPPVLLLPWVLDLVRSPGLLLTEAGLPGPGLADPGLPPWQLILLHPGGPGTGPVWVLAPLPVVALAALLARRRRRPVLAAWAGALAGLATAAVLLRVPVHVPAVQGPLAGWPGPGVVLAALGMLAAAAFGAERAAQVLSAEEFSWRQAAAVVLAGAAGLGLLTGGVWWVLGGAADPLARRGAATLPAYVVQEASGPERPRTLVLSPVPARDGDAVGYALVRGGGLGLGDAETSPPASAAAPLDLVVGDLLSGRGGDEVEDLTRFGVRYVYLPEPVDAALAERLDGLAGLVRGSAPDGGALWRLEGVSARVTLRATDGSSQVVPSGPVDVGAQVPADVSPRLLVLAETADAGWRAVLAGGALQPQLVDGWAQGFRIPAGVGGRLAVEHRDPARAVWLVGQAVAWIAVIVLAAPSLRRTRGVDDVTPDEDDESEPEPGGPGPGRAEPEPERRGAADDVPAASPAERAS